MLIGAPKLEDFQPISDEELKQMLLGPTLQALQQGVPVTQPTSMPMGALCRVLRTIQVLGAQSNYSHELFTEVFEALDGEKHAGLKARVAPIVLSPEEAAAYADEVAPAVPDLLNILNKGKNGEVSES